MLRKALRYAFISLALAVAATPLDSAAFQARFEGWLMSDNASDAPIRIVLDLEVNPVGLSGTVKTAPPLPAAGVVNGEEQFGTCDLRSDLGRVALLKMKGACAPYMVSFTGSYYLRARDGKRQVGVFKLTKTTSTSIEGPRTAEAPPAAPTLTPTKCIRANSACLGTCPRGDYNAELLCANRCKQKLKICKANRPSVPDAPPTPPNE